MSKPFWSLALVICAVALAVTGLERWRGDSGRDAPGSRQDTSPAIAAPSPDADATPSPSAARIPFVAGQVWRYKTRPGEEKSRLTIIKVETLRGQSMVHVALSNLVLELSGQPALECSHLPFSEQAIRDSVLLLEGVAKGDRDMAGYDDWRAAFDQGKAGIFTGPVNEALAGMAQAAESKE